MYSISHVLTMNYVVCADETHQYCIPINTCGVTKSSTQ